MAEHRDEPVNSSQPPNSPMGFGAKRRAGYGHYDGQDLDPNEASRGVPGAHGDPEGKAYDPHQDTSKGDEVNEEMDIVHPSESPGYAIAEHGAGKDHGPT